MTLLIIAVTIATVALLFIVEPPDDTDYGGPYAV